MISTNILIVGQTGVGKSSLLNYLFGAPLQETGVGKPITERGIYPHRYRLSEQFEAVIYDTWGLEADRAEEWEQLITKEVSVHNGERIADWFHTVFFCFSAARARIEEFELRIAKQLAQSGCNLLYIITNAGNPGITPTVDAMRQLLLEHGVEQKRIIPVSSVEKKSFSGKIEPFGKEQLLNGIRDGLWKTICDKLPGTLIAASDSRLIAVRTQLMQQADKTFHLWNYTGSKLHEKFSAECEAKMAACCDQIEAAWSGILSEAVEYYRQLMAAYGIKISVKLPQLAPGAIRLQRTTGERLSMVLQPVMFAALTPVGGVIAMAVGYKKHQKEIKEKLSAYFEDAAALMRQNALQCELLR